MKKELYLYGDEKDIEKVLNIWKSGVLEGITLVDLLPDLSEEYIKEQGIKRE
jgi:hypothetical protein